MTRHPVATNAETADSANSAPIYDEFVLRCKPGPWGELQYSRLLIEPPDEFVTAHDLQPDELKWVFKGYTPEKLHELWQHAELSDAQITELTAHIVNPGEPDSITIKPTGEFILGLSTKSRTVLYSALSEFPENPSQNEPFRFRAGKGATDEWFSNSGLSPETIKLVTGLLYQRGTALLFSDDDVVLPLLPNRSERFKLMKTLARKSTLLVKLRVKTDSDLDTLVNYWGQGPRAKDLRPLLESISHRPRGITLDVAHLLPRFARARLYNYPQPSDHPDDGMHDCHWTCLNFFNDVPDEKYTDAKVVKHTFETEYVRVVGKPTLGDIFVFSRPDGRVIHSCVYIADDIVFTKNGASSVMPWILMNLSDVTAFYPADPPLTISAFRRKDL
ncbi:MAG: hypothetical protein JSS11_15205 [Verrucomicrobia bacterium]|nr:hypothetical protein [Verrucomicrobiota bacterium]